MNALITFLLALLRAFLPVIVQSSKDTSEDGDANTELRDRLRKRVRDTWGKAARLSVLAICLVTLSGCFTRVIYVPDGTPVRLRENIKKAKVWVLDKNGQPVASEMDLPEGWFVLPPEPDKKE